MINTSIKQAYIRFRQRLRDDILEVLYGADFQGNTSYTINSIYEELEKKDTPYTARSSLLPLAALYTFELKAALRYLEGHGYIESENILQGMRIRYYSITSKGIDFYERR